MAPTGIDQQVLRPTDSLRRSPAHHVATARTAHQTGKQRPLAVAATRRLCLDGICGLPQLHAHERWMRARLNMLSASRPAEIGGIADQMVHGGACPRRRPVRWVALVQVRGDPRPRLPRRTQLECALDQGCGHRVGDDWLGSAGLGVAGGRPEVDAPTDGTSLGLLPALLELTALHSTKREEERHRELAHRGRRVNPEIHDRYLRAGLVHALRKTKRIGDAGTRQPVQMRDREATGLARADTREHRVQSRPMQLAPGLVQILMPSTNPDAARIGPSLDAVALHLRADERVAFSSARLGNPDVAVQRYVYTRSYHETPHVD